MNLIKCAASFIQFLEEINNSEAKEIDGIEYVKRFNELVEAGARMKSKQQFLLTRVNFERLLSVVQGKTVITKEKMDSYDENLYTLTKLMSYLKQINMSDFNLVMWLINPVL